MDLKDLYRDVILDHNKRPRNFGTLDPADARADGHNPLCGDRLTVTVRLQGDRIEDIRFEGKGCAISTASASLMTEAVKGKAIAEVAALCAEYDVPLHTDAVRSSSHARALLRKSFDKSAPTGQRSTTFAAHACDRVAVALGFAPSEDRSKMSTSEASTRGIEVRVRSRYVPEQSDPDRGGWLFAYTVHIANGSNETVQRTRGDGLTTIDLIDDPGNGPANVNDVCAGLPQCGHRREGDFTEMGDDPEGELRRRGGRLEPGDQRTGGTGD